MSGRSGETEVNADTIITRGQKHVETVADGEVVLMHIDTGRFFTLSGTGRRAWELMAEPTSVDAIVARLTDEYDVDDATCRAEIFALCRQLEAGALIDVSA